jgi:hypothetical protein
LRCRVPQGVLGISDALARPRAREGRIR